MPEISRFYGIVIEMRPRDHLPPHFHARCGDDRILVHIADGTIIGSFPKSKLTLVRSWLELHRAELLDNWTLLQRKKQARYIEPL